MDLKDYLSQQELLLKCLCRINLKSKIQNEFEEVVRELSLFAPLLAKQLAEQGPRTTALAKEFLERPFLSLAEGEMLQGWTRTSTTSYGFYTRSIGPGELGESGQLGIDLAEGVVVGIESRKEDIEDIFTDTMIEAVKVKKESNFIKLTIYVDI